MRKTTSRPSLDALFDDAMRQPQGTERDAWIREACAGDTLLERELHELIAAAVAAGEALAESVRGGDER